MTLKACGERHKYSSRPGGSRPSAAPRRPGAWLPRGARAALKPPGLSALRSLPPQGHTTRRGRYNFHLPSTTKEMGAGRPSHLLRVTLSWRRRRSYLQPRPPEPAPTRVESHTWMRSRGEVSGPHEKANTRHSPELAG